jgi:WD40 repeat protein
LQDAIQTFDAWQKAPESQKNKTSLPHLALQQIYHNIHERNRLDLAGYKLGNVTVSPDGNVIAAVGQTNTKMSSSGDPASDFLIVWDNDQRKFDKKHQDRTKQDQVFDLDFSQDSQYLATGGKNNTVYTWEMKEGKPNKLPFEVKFPEAAAIEQVSFSPDGQYIAASTFTGQIKVWPFNPDASTSEPISLDLDSKWNVQDLSISGHCLVTVGAPGDSGQTAPIQIWDISSGSSGAENVSGQANLPRIRYSPGLVRFNAQGNRVAMASRGDSLIWKFDSESCRFVEPPTPIQTFSLSVPVKEASFAPKGGERLAFIGEGAFQGWQLEAKTPLIDKKFTPSATGQESIQFLDGRNQLITASLSEPFMRIWDLGGASKTGLPQAKSISQATLPSQLSLRRLPPETSDRDTSDPTTALLSEGKVTLYTNSIDSNAIDLDKARRFTAIAANTKGKYLITGDDQGKVERWEWTGKKLDNQTTSVNEEVKALAWSPTKQLIAVATDQRLMFCNPGKSCEEDVPIEPNTQQIQFSPDGEYVVVLSSDKGFELIKLAGKSSVSPPTEPKIRDVKFFPLQNGSEYRLATLSSSGEVMKFWRFSGGEPVETWQLWDFLLKFWPLSGGNAPEKPAEFGSLKVGDIQGNKPGRDTIWNQIQFSENGKYMAAGSESAKDSETEIQIWDVSALGTSTTDKPLEKKLINIFSGDWGTIHSLEFRDSGNLMASGSALVKINIATEQESPSLEATPATPASPASFASLGCQWLQEYHQSYPQSKAKSICDRILPPDSSSDSSQDSSSIASPVTNPLVSPVPTPLPKP